MFGNMGDMMKKFQKLQAQMAESQKQLESREVEGSSGGGMIKVTANGQGAVQRIKIDPSLLDPKEIEVLEDLLVAALSDARVKVEETTAQEMSKVTGGLNLPAGMKLPF
jgi:DNA-binding YbaB/EbfC family protein